MTDPTQAHKDTARELSPCTVGRNTRPHSTSCKGCIRADRIAQALADEGERAAMQHSDEIIDGLGGPEAWAYRAGAEAMREPLARALEQIRASSGSLSPGLERDDIQREVHDALDLPLPTPEESP